MQLIDVCAMHICVRFPRPLRAYLYVFVCVGLILCISSHMYFWYLKARNGPGTYHGGLLFYEVAPLDQTMKHIDAKPANQQNMHSLLPTASVVLPPNQLNFINNGRSAPFATFGFQFMEFG